MAAMLTTDYEAHFDSRVSRLGFTGNAETTFYTEERLLNGYQT
jgi:hypothetical protein